MQNINRHVWKLLAAVGAALMAYAWADEERFNQAELFGLGLVSQRRAFCSGVPRPARAPPGDNGPWP